MNGKKALIAATGGIGLLSLVPYALAHSSFRLNLTASVPVGIYRAVPRVYAAICLPESTIKSAERAGLSVPHGECPDGKEPILKSLYLASPETPIVFTPQGFFL